MSLQNENRTSAVKSKKPAPGYMQMTRAAQGKSRRNLNRETAPDTRRESGEKNAHENQPFKGSTSLSRFDFHQGRSRTFNRTKSIPNLVPTAANR